LSATLQTEGLIIYDNRIDCNLFSVSLAVVIRDAFPVSAGHTIIVPRRHISSFFEATDTERASLLRLLDEAKVTLDAEHQPDGYNIGINDGVVADPCRMN